MTCTTRITGGTTTLKLSWRVVQVTPLKDGYEYRIWTNTGSASFNGREYRFPKVGEYTLKVPSSPRGVYLIHGL